MTEIPDRRPADIALDRQSATVTGKRLPLRLVVADTRSDIDRADITAACLTGPVSGTADTPATTPVYSVEMPLSLPFHRKWAEYLKITFQLLREIGRADVAVVFVSDLSSILFVFLPSLAAGHFYRVKLIVHIGGRPLVSPVFWLRRLLKSVLVLASGRVTGSDREATQLARMGLVVDVIPPVLLTAPRRIPGPLQPHVIFTVRTWDDVEVTQVVGAYAIVKQKYPRAVLDVAAPLKLHGRLWSIVQSESGSSGHAIQIFDLSRRRELLAAGDLCICSASDNRVSTDLMTAWQRGIPVLVPEYSVSADSVRDRENGLVFSSLHRSSLADRILELVENPGLATLIAQGGAAEADRYSWEAVEPKWRRLLAAEPR